MDHPARNRQKSLAFCGAVRTMGDMETTITAAFKIDRPRTWLGRHGQQAMTSSKTGRRLIIHRWSDTGETELTDVEGDAWRSPDSFVQYSKTALGVTESIADAVAKADALRGASDR